MRSIGMVNPWSGRIRTTRLAHIGFDEKVREPLLSISYGEIGPEPCDGHHPIGFSSITSSIVVVRMLARKSTASDRRAAAKSTKKKPKVNRSIATKS